MITWQRNPRKRFLFVLLPKKTSKLSSMCVLFMTRCFRFKKTPKKGKQKALLTLFTLKHLGLSRRWVTARLRDGFFLFPCTSKANRPKIIIQIKHPVNCAQAASFVFFTSHLTPTLPLHCYRPPEKTGFIPSECRRRAMRGWHIVLFMAWGGVTFSTRHNTWPFVKHSHYRQRKKGSEPQIRSTCHPGESRNLKSILCLCGYSSQWDFAGVWRIVLCLCDSGFVRRESSGRSSWAL